MSKRRLGRKLDEVAEETLSELTPDERLTPFIKACADGNEQWLERLRETAPMETYRQTDRAYVERGNCALRFLQHAMYDLHTAYLELTLLETQQMSRWVIDRLSDGKPSEEDLEQAGKRAQTLRLGFVELYTQYHAYRQFAEEVLGVSFETWVELHHDGPSVLDKVCEALDDSILHDLAEEELNETRTSDEWITLDELADLRYQGLVATWEDAVPSVSSS